MKITIRSRLVGPFKYIYDIFCLKYSHFKDDLDYDFFKFSDISDAFCQNFLASASYIYFLQCRIIFPSLKSSLLTDNLPPFIAKKKSCRTF